MNHTIQWAVPLLALSFAPLLAANAAPPEPGPAASSAMAPYHSAFADYKPWSDIARGDWRRLNASAGASPMAGMAGKHDMATPAQAMATMPGMTAASRTSPGHAAMHGSAGGRHDGQGAQGMPGMKGMSSSAAPAASAPHAGHSMPGGRQ